MEATENNGQDNGAQNFNGRDQTGKFVPGNPGKPKGSSKNKLRDEIRSFLNESWNDFPVWFAKLKEKDKIEIWLALAPYGISRLQSVAMTDSDGNDIPNRGIDPSVWDEEDLRTLIKLQEKYVYRS